MSKGKFISIDGIEGAGKSTQIKQLTTYLKTRGIKTLSTQEPGGTKVGRQIRHLLLDKNISISAKTESLLMFADRIEHIKTVIKPALKENIWVISDRFSDASYAYQGGGRHLGFNAILQLERWATDCFTPDLSFFLDIPVALSLQRLAQRGTLDRFECEDNDFFYRVHKTFLTLAKAHPERIYLIDATQDITSVHEQIKKILAKKF